MKFSNVRLLVKDFAKCFKFYSEQLGLEPAWGDENSGYAYFKVADGIEGFALFVSSYGSADSRKEPMSDAVFGVTILIIFKFSSLVIKYQNTGSTVLFRLCAIALPL